MLGPARKTVNSARALFNYYAYYARSRFNTARSRFGLRPFIWGGFLALLAVALDFVPLYDLLGYDFAFAIGFGAALAGVDIGQGVMARARATLGRAPAGSALARVFGQATALSAATLLLPLLF